ncbi:unnamed protein product [Aureobasidium mustum]|uniref:Uncharacterized protein n=1 Tax=Aureobasidium mustum TaxID=2773714 RepID=A0A9N8JEX4_9PEZI|nr:unnamed protein product [Aureobasidium mustum]
MEWQMSGNEAARSSRPHGPDIKEEEEIEMELRESDTSEGQEQMQEQGTKYRGEDITAGEAVAERTPKSTSGR